ncbi:DUF4282 domain-containing protein [Pseudobacillus wudalianchiensis]|uniref:DUF4282 domain-containing protein n=1 Tax=Pseudobacillus wudalianchiensis TaxID=1743143 RepID=A0A1B9AYE3_9BACI|nr:DUF4282 domain-containing protein [Bacillus wudalianchiensis]OCA88899.1 hypothetical protein A8F95_05595 [Bacillus wudalianchiensis]
MANFLSFDKMITPTIIKIIFWVGVVMSVLSGLSMIITGFNSYYGSGFAVLTGLLTIVLGPLLVRVYCELLILFFKMHDSVKNIERHMQAGQREKE